MPKRHTKAKLAAVAGMALAATAAVMTIPSALAGQSEPATVGAKDALSGVGFADRDEWADWRGQKVQINETWNDPKDSSGNLTWDGMNNLWSVKDSFSDGKWDGALSLAQPMYASDQNVGDCASESQIQELMVELGKAWPRKDAFIRLGWEFNGNWYSWSQKPSDAEAFKACWIRWHDEIKKASPDYKLVFNPNAESINLEGQERVNVDDFWPGAKYVDAAGPDFYARNDNGKLRDPNKKGEHGEPLGIQAWADWVHDKGVPLAVPEWGVHEEDYGSTDPQFINQMRDVFQKAAKSDTGLAYEDYFDGSTSFGCKFTLHDKECGFDKHKAAADRYQSLFNKPYEK